MLAKLTQFKPSEAYTAALPHPSTPELIQRSRSMHRMEYDASAYQLLRIFAVIPFTIEARRPRMPISDINYIYVDFDSRIYKQQAKMTASVNSIRT